MWFRTLIVALTLALCLGSCWFSKTRTIEGRLGEAFGCRVVTDGGRTYELTRWHDRVPPLGSYVVLKVLPLEGYVSVCMVGEIVEVLDVVRVITDFRTRPVTGDETWGPGDPIVLGRVEVVPGATLTILPGARVSIIPYGELRVRGALHLVGTAADSVRVTGGNVVLDSASAESRVGFASLQSIVVHGDGPDLEHVAAGGLSVSRGSVTVRDSRIRYGISGDGGSITTLRTDFPHASLVFGGIEIEDADLERIDLSYAEATVRHSRFGGARTYLLFHGQSGGSFERNVFAAPLTEIVVRHGSDPGFHDNDLIGAQVNVACESRTLTSCVHLERNWWGTAEEASIRAKLAGDCAVCIDEWRSAPVGGTP